MKISKKSHLWFIFFLCLLLYFFSQLIHDNKNIKTVSDTLFNISCLCLLSYLLKKQSENIKTLTALEKKIDNIEKVILNSNYSLSCFIDEKNDNYKEELAHLLKVQTSDLLEKTGGRREENELNTEKEYGIYKTYSLEEKLFTLDPKTVPDNL